MTESTDAQLLRELSGLSTSIELLRNELVRKDVYIEQRVADRAAVAAVVEDVKEIKDTMRWLSRALVASLVIPLITSAIMLYVSQQVVR